MGDNDHLRGAAGAIAVLPIIVKAVVGGLVLAAAIAMALGKISVVIGGGGLAAFLLYAIVSSIVNKRRLEKAMRESDRD